MSVSKVSLSATARSDFGKGAARRLRRAGDVPAVIYGHGTDPIHVAVSAHDLAQALKHRGVVLSVSFEGKDFTVAPRDVQRDVVRQVIEHVDLVIVDRAEVAAREAAVAAAEAAEAAEAAAVAAAADAAAGAEAEAGADEAAETASDDA